ncbi:hypothetical protein [Lentzea sp. NPDC051838]|uniref:hypothetical protein n=1 Tax=Lentzea sp. NPDC051838 TaxID=3154849 RepID=UPI00342D7546
MNRSLVLVAAAAALVLSACTSTPDSSPAPTSTPESTSTPPPVVVTEMVTQTVTNPPKPDAVVQTDNRLGYGPLKLGMTLDEVKATGMAPADFGAEERLGCWVSREVVVSKKLGLVLIKLPADARTSAGIGVGSTVADVKKSYPEAKEYRDGFETKLGADASLAFLSISKTNSMFFADNDEIVAIKILANGADCAMSDLR